MSKRIEELRNLVRQQVDAIGREVRFITQPVELRAEDGKKPVLVGHASVFNQETVIMGWFREKVAPGAFTETIQDADIRHLFNHDPNYVLGRNKSGTLRLGEDKVGLAYEVDLNVPDDPDAVRVEAKVKRGDVNQSSFAFRVIKDMWEEPDDPDSGELPIRTLVKVKLYDTSTVTYPAYEAADAGLRMVGLDILTKALEITDEERMKLLLALTSGVMPENLEPILARMRGAVDGLITITHGDAGPALPEILPDGETLERTDEGIEPADLDQSEPSLETDEGGETHSDEEALEIMRLRHRHNARVMVGSTYKE